LGFFVALAGLLCSPWQSLIPRAAASLSFALSLLLRFLWVIGLLRWQFNVIRGLLLALLWACLAWACWRLADPLTWIRSIACMGLCGSLTEAYNLVTEQWSLDDSPLLSGRLKRDHIQGMISSGLTGIFILSLPLWLSTGSIDWLLAILSLIEWCRLAEMISCHRRLSRIDYAQV
jgi:hypothetical protein